MDDTSKPPKHLSPQWVTAIAIIALIAVIALAYAVNKIWRDNDVANQALTQQLKDTTALVNKMQTQQQMILNQQKQALNTYEKKLEQALKSQQAHKSDWAIVNAVYLGKLAHYKLYYEHNIPAAVSILKTAYDELNQVQGLDARTAQKAITIDVNTLNAYPNLNRQALYLQLSQIDKQLKKLPVLAAANTSKLYQTAKPAAKTWRDSLHNSWETLKGIIVIRHHAQTSPALISAKASTHLYQNCHELISQAQLALLNRDGRIYHDNLSRVLKWLNTYFVKNNPLVAKTIKQIIKLNQININPTLPSIRNTLAALNQLALNEVRHK